MKKLVKNIKLMVAAATVLALFAVAPVVHGGILWTDIDPIFNVDGHLFNVVIKWPDQYTCSIADPIDVQVYVPNDSSYVFILESSDDVGDCGTPQSTVTKANFVGDNDRVKVKALLRSELDFPFMVEVYLDGKLIDTETEDSNRWTDMAMVEF